MGETTLWYVGGVTEGDSKIAVADISIPVEMDGVKRGVCTGFSARRMFGSVELRDFHANLLPAEALTVRIIKQQDVRFVEQ